MPMIPIMKSLISGGTLAMALETISTGSYAGRNKAMVCAGWKNSNSTKRSCKLRIRKASASHHLRAFTVL
jgi:hypothetical protein